MNQSPTKNSKEVPPQDVEAERCLLGCLMLDRKAMAKVADFLRSEDYYKQTHQEIYKAMIELFEKSEPIDVLSVSARLKEKDSLEQVGGSSYLSECVNSVPTAAHVLNYAKIVQKKRILRDLISAGYDIENLGHNQTEDVDVLLDRAEKRIFDVSQKSLTQSFTSMKDSLSEAFDRIDQLSKNRGIPRGLPTGFKGLDNILAGLQKSDLIILASRPTLGKSSLALDFTRHAAVEKNTPVGFFSLEMSTDQLVDRLIANQAKISLWKIRTGRLSDSKDSNDFSRIQQAMGALNQAPIFIDDTPSINILQMRAMARRLQAKEGLGLIVVDYLQLMEPRNSSDSVVRQITEISRSLKSLARELEVPVLALSQLSRAVEQRSPQIPRLSDLRQSGSLEQDSDVVMFIYKEDKYKPETSRKNIADIIVAKHRNGPPGRVELYFDEQTVSFRSLEKGYKG